MNNISKSTSERKAAASHQIDVLIQQNKDELDLFLLHKVLKKEIS
jgi:hypothetical protein